MLLFSSLTFLSDKLNFDFSNFVNLPDHPEGNGTEIATLLLAVVAIFYGAMYLTTYYLENLKSKIEEANEVVDELNTDGVVPGDESKQLLRGHPLLPSMIAYRENLSIVTQRLGILAQVASIALSSSAFVYVLFYAGARIGVIIQVFT